MLQSSKHLHVKIDHAKNALTHSQKTEYVNLFENNQVRLALIPLTDPTLTFDQVTFKNNTIIAPNNQNN